MEKIITQINANERKVLEHMADEWSQDEPPYFYFRHIVNGTGLELKQVRRACRSLTKKGLAEFTRGLMSEDGVAGAGYTATLCGAALIHPCDKCGNLAYYDYYVDKDGKMSWWEIGKEKMTRVRVCGEHYEENISSKVKTVEK